MDLEVRQMTLAESGMIIDYFHSATPEHLEILGVDPTRLPAITKWKAHYRHEFELPVEQRSALMLVWRSEGAAVGFSTADKIIFGERAHMHMHIVEPPRRSRTIGAECVRRSVEIYFESLKLRQLFCEPHAFNVAPNRTLQKAGFKYVKTYMTVPGPLNYHQAVNRWAIER